MKIAMPIVSLLTLTLLQLTVGAGCAAPRLAVMRDAPAPAAITETLPGLTGTAGPLTLRRVVHASVLLEAGEVRVLTDPWFTETNAYNHGEPIALTIDKLPKLTAVVATHGHYDHFDIAAFAAYPDKSVPMIVRSEMVEAAKAAGFTDVRPLEHWQSTDVGAGAGALKVTATPAAHGVPESTYVIEMGGYTVYFGGDTRLIPELREIPKKFPHIDLALVAVNGLTVTGAGQMVMNAQEAAELVALLRAKVAVPMHYTFHGNWFTDTFILSYTGTPAEFVAATKSKSPATKVFVLEPGAPLVLDGASAAPAAAPASGDAPAASAPTTGARIVAPPVVRVTFDEAQWRDVEHARVAPLVGDPRTGPFFMLIELKGNSTSPRHTHSFDKQGMVVRGTVVHAVDGDSTDKPLPANAFFHIAANVPHFTKCTTPEPCVLLYSQPGAIDMKVLD